MSSTPEFNEKQLAAARAQAWHQDGEQLLTLEAAREWLDVAGLVLFAPRPQLATPAPSLVEATLGAANEAPTLAETQIARDLTARLTTEGNGVPLNLFGSLGDAPDFVASTQVFSYIFTLRGDKAWKQAPSTSGSTKVTPLALAVYEALTAKGAQTAAELANELGREVTEAAIQRALTELWSQLRVLPQLAREGESSLWELTTQRFTKAIKAGANAGQPRALSALISVYLSQALTATEDEIEIFLSPLTARSRVREVLHALTAARQLETVVLEGKTLLYIPGELPEFPVLEEESAADQEGAEAADDSESQEEKPAERIRRFGGERKPAGSFREGERERRPFNRAGAGGGDRERRPYNREGSGGGDRERRPYNREGSGGGDRERRPYNREGAGERRPYNRAGSGGGDRERRPYNREGSGERRPYNRAGSGGGDRERRPYNREGSGGGDRERRPYNREGSGERRPYNREGSGGGDRERRPYNREGAGSGERKPFQRREGGGDRPSFSRSKPSFSKPWDEDRKSSGGERPSYQGGRKPFGGGRGARDGQDRGPAPRRFSKPGFDREQRSDSGGEVTRAFPRRPFTPREDAGGEGRPARPSFDRKPREKKFGDKPGFGGKPKFGGKPGAKFGGKPKFSGKSKFGDKPGFGSKPGGRSGKPAGKKFGGKPPVRKPKPKAEE